VNILVIGGCGYIGSILVPELLLNGHKVHVLDNLRYQQRPFLDICHHKEFAITVGDCRDEKIISSLVSSHDVVIMLAAIVGSPQCDAQPFDAMTTNLDAVYLLLRHLSPNQYLLYPCTNSGYGIGKDNVFCTEESPLNPISLYGRTKVKAEKCILERGNAISFRLATVCGSSPCLRTSLLVNNFVLQAYRDAVVVLFESHFKRNYIHVRDVAQAFLLGIEKFNDMKNNIYNVGLSIANLSKRELCEKIKEHLDFVIIEHAFAKDPDQRNYIVSNDKIEKQGFVPKWNV